MEELAAAASRTDLSRAAAQIIGMREVALHLAGDLSAEGLRERLIIRTRRLARAQDTWIRKTPGIVTVDLGDDEPEDHVPAVLAHVT